MPDDRKMLSVEEAMEKAEAGAKGLEEIIKEFSKEPKIDDARHAELVAHYMSLLSETFKIDSPDDTDIK